ncbi:MAG: CDP-2,3-bis-(O-geranylgeranyl)-sn-glycerol synthase [Thermoplasmata archaeon]
MLFTIIEQIINVLWFTLPSYVANPGAVIFKGKTPLDFNKNFLDGRRILGKGKTWRGFFGGALTGIFIGLVEIIISFLIPNNYLIKFSNSITDSIFIVIILSFGSMLGDSVGSFIKRRLKIESGSNVLILDQYPFIIISLFLIYIFYQSQFFKIVWNPVAIITLIIYTPLIHRFVNIIGYKLGKKEVPW